MDLEKREQALNMVVKAEEQEAPDQFQWEASQIGKGASAASRPEASQYELVMDPNEVEFLEGEMLEGENEPSPSALDLEREKRTGLTEYP